MPNTGPSTVKGLEKKQVGCHVSPATPKGAGEGGTQARPQVYPQVHHWVPGGLRHVPWIFWTCHVILKVRESARCHHANLPSSTEVWGKSFLLLENHRGFTFLNKTEKKASTENNELKGITILFVEDIKSPRYIKLTCLHLPNGAGCFWGLLKH